MYKNISPILYWALDNIVYKVDFVKLHMIDILAT